MTLMPLLSHGTKDSVAMLVPTHEHGFSPEEVHEIMDGIYARGDRLMVWFLVSHMALALLLALYHGTWFATLLVGSLTCAIFGLSVWLFPRTFFTRSLSGVAQQAFVALHIYQLHGQAEQHFWFFTAFTMMIVYQDWRCMWPGALLIIVQHSLFAGLHNSGYPVHFFPERYVDFTKLFFHFGIALVQVALCGYWAHLLRLQTLGDAWRRRQLRDDQRLLEDQLDQLKASEAKLSASGEALRDASRRQRAILDNSTDALWVKDLNGRYTAVNTAFARMVNRPVDTIVGLSGQDIAEEGVVARVTAQQDEVLRTGLPVTYDYPIDARGEERVLEVTISAITDDRGKPTGFAGSARDVTERRRAEEERQRDAVRMQEAQKLESLGLLAGGIAHDFNNLLGVIRANAEVARAELNGSAEPSLPLEHIEQATERAADLTRQMLAYAGMGRVTITRVDVAALVRGTASLLRAAVSKKVELRFELDETIPAVEGDATQLRQVVMNLISNAADAIGEADGVVTLRTIVRHVRDGDVTPAHGLESLAAGLYVVVEVADTGGGMSGETLRRIFDPFFTTKFVGRGLGLAAVIGILRAHRGAVDIVSEPGRGSLFSIYLPASATEAGGTPPLENTAPDSGLFPEHLGATVLVVDDEQMLRSLASRVLTRAGCHVIEASDGMEAMERLKETSHVDMVLLDMLMPRMNGEETLKAIRAIHPTLPVLLSSGFSEAVAAQRLLDDPHVRFMQKPYGARELVQAVALSIAQPQS
ncbi:MAG: response regulator [Gemmatimonadaceae bacterium]|nr:response regulator [Gemmatimonadaceae bacterium]